MKRWDFLIIALVIAFSLLMLFPFACQRGDMVRIEQHGNLLYEGETNIDTVIEADGNTITIEDGHIMITASDCPDGLCRRGECTPLHPLICLPNELSVTIISEEVDVDAISS